MTGPASMQISRFIELMVLRWQFTMYSAHERSHQSRQSPPMAPPDIVKTDVVEPEQKNKGDKQASFQSINRTPALELQPGKTIR